MAELVRTCGQFFEIMRFRGNQMVKSELYAMALGITVLLMRIKLPALAGWNSKDGT